MMTGCRNLSNFLAEKQECKDMDQASTKKEKTPVTESNFEKYTRIHHEREGKLCFKAKKAMN